MTKLTIEHEGIRVTVELCDNKLVGVREIFDLFRSAFLGSTFTWDQFYNEIYRINEEID